MIISTDPQFLGTIPIPCCYPLTEIPVVSREYPHGDHGLNDTRAAKILSRLGSSPQPIHELLASRCGDNDGYLMAIDG